MGRLLRDIISSPTPKCCQLACVRVKCLQRAARECASRTRHNDDVAPRTAHRSMIANHGHLRQRSLVHLLSERALEHPEFRLYTFVDTGDERSLGCAELDARARGIAAALQ